MNSYNYPAGTTREYWYSQQFNYIFINRLLTLGVHGHVTGMFITKAFFHGHENGGQGPCKIGRFLSLYHVSSCNWQSFIREGDRGGKRTLHVTVAFCSFLDHVILMGYYPFLRRWIIQEIVFSGITTSCRCKVGEKNTHKPRLEKKIHISLLLPCSPRGKVTHVHVNRRRSHSALAINLLKCCVVIR